MDIDVFQAQELPQVLRVLRTVLEPEHPLDADQRRFLATYARITGFPLAATDPAPIETRAVRIEGAHPRKRLIQLAAIAAFLSRPVQARSVAFLRALAQQLDTHDGAIDVLDAIVHKRFLRARLLTARRGMRGLLKEAHTAGGTLGVLRLLAAMLLKRPVDRDKLAGYKHLGLLPDGTLGREYWKHMTREGFGFPGEPGGIADAVAYHDVAHVLAEHAATALGEIQQGCFQGGNRREDGFSFIQFVMLQFHQGIRVTPNAPSATDNFDPEKVLWAIHRGAQCTVDMTHQWNYWPLMTLPLQEARARCGLLPKLSAI